MPAVVVQAVLLLSFAIVVVLGRGGRFPGREPALPWVGQQRYHLRTVTGNEHPRFLITKLETS